MLQLVKPVPKNQIIPYHRDLFPTWTEFGGPGCTIRDYVLDRDNVAPDYSPDSESCVSPGLWISPYDLEETTDSSLVEIGHIVPLKEAWVSGANAWDAEKREEFANDIFAPELLAVSRESNREKGDKDPAEWLPPNENFHCDYVMAWFDVKTSYELTFDAAEKEALLNVLTGPLCRDRE